MPQAVKAKAALGQLGPAQRGFAGAKKDEKPAKAGAKRTVLGGAVNDENGMAKKSGMSSSGPGRGG